MSLQDLLIGRALRSEEQEEQTIGALRGVPVLGLDALASAAYGPEAALTVMIGLGAVSVHFIEPISAVIIGVLFLVFLSYRQTIAAYPGGGGSYTVARENLGPVAGLVAAGALSLDYVLNVAVAISAGVGAVVSAVPALLPHTLFLCLSLLSLLAVVNLRGTREAGLVFMLPTYTFVALLGLTLCLGIGRALLSHGHPVPVAAPPPLPAATAPLGVWVILRAFASGCTAMTGVEAVSNGVPLFREPTVKRARWTLTIIITTLIALLAAIAYLCNAYRIGATTPGEPGYESVLSQVVAAVTGRGAFYYLTMTSIVAVLCFSANTSFSGFPRLCRVLALDEYLPAEFAHLGRRLVYSYGILLLTAAAGLLLILFGGVTDRLIPLFAVGAFLAFTLSQSAMVMHWRRTAGVRAWHFIVLNGAGAAATGATLLVIVVAKFTEGAWIVTLLVPTFVALFLLIGRSYEKIDEETEVAGPLQLDAPPPPVVVIPLQRLDRVARKSIRLAISMSPDVYVVQVLAGEPKVEDLQAAWRRTVEEPIAAAGYPPPKLVVLRSAYREFVGPLVSYIQRLARESPRRYVAVIIPEIVERRWYHFLLHSHRPALLTAYLYLRGGPRVIVVNAPWYLEGVGEEEGEEQDGGAAPGAAGTGAG